MPTDNREYYRSQIANLPEDQRSAATAIIEVEYNLRAAVSAYRLLAKASAAGVVLESPLEQLALSALEEATKLREKYAKDPEEKKKEAK